MNFNRNKIFKLVSRSSALLMLLALLSAAGGAFAQGVPHNISPVTGPNGQPRPGATISFCIHPANAVPCSNFANAYNDIALTQLINQATTPFKTDGLGNVPAFYAAPGIYDFTISGTGIAAPNGPYVINIAPATNGANNWTGPNSFSQQITSTVATGTAPFSIASTTLVPNLNVQLHGGLAAPASAILGLTDTQSPTNKTINVGSNSIVQTTPSAGKYLRDNGTSFQPSSVPAAGAGSCSGVQFPQALNDNATPTCVTPPTFGPSGASHSVGYVPDPGSSAGTTRFLREDATWQAVSGGVNETVVSGTVTSGVCGSASPSNCAVLFIPANAHTLTRLVSVVTTAGVGCSAASQWAVIDLSNSNAVLASGTPANSVGTVTDSGALSVAMTAAHRFALGQANNPTGCTTFEAAIISANFQ